MAIHSLLGKGNGHGETPINSSVTKPVGELLSNHVQTRLFYIKCEAEINLLRTDSSTYRDSDCGQSF